MDPNQYLNTLQLIQVTRLQMEIKVVFSVLFAKEIIS